jgi:hypothetical protein
MQLRLVPYIDPFLLGCCNGWPESSRLPFIVDGRQDEESIMPMFIPFAGKFYASRSVPLARFQHPAG